MKRTAFSLATALALGGLLAGPAPAMPTQAECIAVYDDLQRIAAHAGSEAVKVDGIRVHGVSHIAGTHAKRFEDARADAVNALMDLLVATDDLSRRFKSFCGRE